MFISLYMTYVNENYISHPINGSLHALPLLKALSSKLETFVRSPHAPMLHPNQVDPSI